MGNQIIYQQAAAADSEIDLARIDERKLALSPVEVTVVDSVSDVISRALLTDTQKQDQARLEGSESLASRQSFEVEREQLQLQIKQLRLRGKTDVDQNVIDL